MIPVTQPMGIYKIFHESSIWCLNKCQVGLGRVMGITWVIPGAYFSILFYSGILLINETTSVLRAEPGTGRVGSGSDRDPARGTDLASAGKSAAPTRPSRPVFQQPEDRTDVGGRWDCMVSEDGNGARGRQRRRYFITKLIVYGTVVGLLY